MTVRGSDSDKAGYAFEYPLTFSNPTTIQDIYCYSSQAETITAGIYDSTNSVLKVTTLRTHDSGWYREAFPITFTAGQYYLGRYGTGPKTNLVSNAGVTCFYDKSGNLPAVFTPIASLPGSGLPLYLSGCKPLTIVGNFFGLGGSLILGIGSWGGSYTFMNNFNSWLNQNYGPVTLYNLGASGMNSSNASGAVSEELAGKTLSLCFIELGLGDLHNAGGPEGANCGGSSLKNGLSSSLVYEKNINHVVEVVKDHMVPGGIVMIMNNYQVDDFIYLRFPKWKDYHAILKAYNEAVARVAKKNNIILIDTYSLIKAHPDYITGAELHANNAGQAAMADIMKRAVENSPPPGPFSK